MQLQIFLTSLPTSIIQHRRNRRTSHAHCQIIGRDLFEDLIAVKRMYLLLLRMDLK